MQNESPKPQVADEPQLEPEVASALIPSPKSTRIALRGDLLDFTDMPAWGQTDDGAARYRPDHWLLIDKGCIVAVKPAASFVPGNDYRRIDHRGRLIMPGFIDTHVHCPQLDVIASYGTELLDWLEKYTFPAERHFADPQIAHDGAERFLDALLEHGTTSAVVFPTVHKVSADALFRSADKRRMRLITGKVLMDRHAPEGLCDDVDGAERDCIDLISRWHGVGRNAFALTVRFAPTSSPEQLAMAGALIREQPDLYMQTHVAENRSEVDWVRSLFPEARSYLDVYARAGLLHPRGVLAHGIWLDDEDRAALRDSGAQIAHCPTSNLFLGSGLFAWREMLDSGVSVSMASDVGGGTTLSMIRTMADAYKIQALRGERLTAWVALYTATLGAAQALGLDDEIGSLEPGRSADVCVWDWAVGSVANHRHSLADDLHERLFAWMILADERNLVEAHVAGVLRHAR